MATSADLPAWIALFTGLYALAAGVGELRAPGGWKAMAAELEASHALRFLTGIVTMFMGAVIYLACPWPVGDRAGDILAIVINVLGGLAVAKGLLLLAAPDRFLHLGSRLMNAGPAMAGLSALIGAALIFGGLSRI